jgi:hypothetical protein
MQNKSCEAWESQYEWKLRRRISMRHGLALMLHMTMIQMFSNTCRSSKHVPSLQTHAYGRLGAKHERKLPHTSNKGPVPKPWNHSRTCRTFTSHETTAQSTRRYVARKLLPQCSSHSFEQRTRTEDNIVHGAEGTVGAFLWEILPSLVRFGAPLPHAQHVWEFDIACDILAHKKISSSPTEQKTPRNPLFIACIRQNSPWPWAWVVVFDSDGWTKYIFLEAEMLWTMDPCDIMQATNGCLMLGKETWSWRNDEGLSSSYLAPAFSRFENPRLKC